MRARAIHARGQYAPSTARWPSCPYSLDAAAGGAYEDVEVAHDVLGALRSASGADHDQPRSKLQLRRPGAPSRTYHAVAVEASLVVRQPQKLLQYLIMPLLLPGLAAAVHTAEGATTHHP